VDCSLRYEYKRDGLAMSSKIFTATCLRSWLDRVAYPEEEGNKLNWLRLPIIRGLAVVGLVGWVFLHGVFLRADQSLALLALGVGLLTGIFLAAFAFSKRQRTLEAMLKLSVNPASGGAIPTPAPSIADSDSSVLLTGETALPDGTPFPRSN